MPPLIRFFFLVFGLTHSHSGGGSFEKIETFWSQVQNSANEEAHKTIEKSNSTPFIITNILNELIL